MSRAKKKRDVDSDLAAVDTSKSSQITGILLCIAAVLGFLSLVNYDWKDVSQLCSPPNESPSNLVGVVGAQVAYASYTWLGFAAWLLPVWSALLGITLIAGSKKRTWPKMIWATLFTLSLACVLQLASPAFRSSLEDMNMPFAGGYIGLLGMDLFLVRWLNGVGGGLVAWSLLICAGIFLLGLDSLRTTHRALSQVYSHFTGAYAEWQAEINRRRDAAAEEARLAHDEQGRKEQKAAERLKTGNRENQERGGERLSESERKRNEAEAQREIFARREKEERARAAKERREREQRNKEAREKAARQREAEHTQLDAEEAMAAEKADRPYQLPPITLLDPLPKALGDEQGSDTDAISELLVDTLKDFGLDVKVTNVEVGPVVTRYEILPAPGIRVERISRLSNNIALVLKATSVRVQAPIPGKGVVGIEVPNDISRIVSGREIIEGGKWHNNKAAVPLILGKDVGGQDIITDLAKMPHVLIAGATGSGKSVCMNSILAGLLMSRTPDQLRLMLVDPKIVEFSVYNHLPHLVVPVITDPTKVALGLRWAINEMEKRYKLFAKVGVRNIASYNSREVVTQTDMFGNEKPEDENGDPSTLPYLVIIIDELADLMLAAGADIENSIARLAQLSRAVGIHMILATQRPSVNVITGTIKANFPARIAFQVAQKVDSRTILDSQGAETLLGRGDMLFAPPSSSKLVRAQGALVSDAEVARIVDFIKQQRNPVYIREIKETLDNPAKASDSGGGSGSSDSGGGDGDDDLLEKAIGIIRETKRASTSSLQRRLRIGYTRAARLIDVLEERGIVGPPNGSGPREILIDLDEEIPDNAIDMDDTDGDDLEQDTDETV